MADKVEVGTAAKST